MVSDTFEQLLKVQCDELQHKLTGEHRSALQRLEARISALEDENQVLRKQATKRFDGNPEEKLLSEAPLAQGAAKSDFRNSNSESWTVMATSTWPLRSLYPVSMPQESVASEQTLPGHPIVPGPDVATSEYLPPYTQTTAATEEASTSGSSDSKDTVDMGLGFRVLDVWETSQMRIIKRNNSCQSLDCSLSSSNSSAIFSFLGDEESEEGMSYWELKMQRVMITPSSPKHLIWELAGFVLITYDIVVIPLQIFMARVSTAMIVTSWLIRIFWTLDMPFSFLLGYVNAQGLVEMRPSRVGSKYARTRLMLDLLIVSIDWAEAVFAMNTGGGGSQDTTVLRLLGMLRAIRLVRLVRLVKSQKITEFIFEHIRSEGVMLVAYIILIMSVLLGLVHIISCIWYGIHAGGAWHSDGDASAGEFSEEYTSAFHFVLALFVGELLLDPANLGERLFTIVVCLFGFVISSTFVGSLTTAMTRLQIIASKRSTQFAALNRYLSDYDISRELTARVQRNARHALREEENYTPESSVELMLLISDPLRSEIHYEVFSPPLMVHPFFRLYNQVNQAGLRHVCHGALAQMSLSRGDVIFTALEVPVAPKMFFVRGGRLTYMRGMMEPHQTVTSKHWLAEAVLWTKWAHRGTLRALTECHLLSIDSHKFGNIMSTFPTQHGLSYAVRFVDSINQIHPPTDLTDLGEADEQARYITVRAFQDQDKGIELPDDWYDREGRRSSSLSIGSLSAVIRRRISVTSVPNLVLPAQ